MIDCLFDILRKPVLASNEPLVALLLSNGAPVRSSLLLRAIRERCSLRTLELLVNEGGAFLSAYQCYTALAFPALDEAVVALVVRATGADELQSGCDAAKFLVFDAVQRNDAVALRVLLAAGAWVDSSALCCAISRFDLVRQLVDVSGLRVDRRSWTVACFEVADHNLMAKLMARTPRAVLAERPWSRFRTALLKGDMQEIAEMIELTPDACVAAAGDPNADVLAMLIKAGANLHVSSTYGYTPCLNAAGNENEAVMRLLLDNNVDVNHAKKNGETPCHVAARNRNTKVLAMLIAASADVHALDEHGRTPLFEAAESTETGESISMLLAAGARIDVVSNSGATPCHIAAYSMHVAALTALIAAGADVNAVDNDGQTPCHHAASNRNDAVISALISAGANVDAFDKKRVSPAILAAANPNERVLAALIATGANVVSPDANKRVAVAVAATNENEAVLAQLIEIGVDLEVADSNGWRPVHFATQNQNEKVLTMLIDAGVSLQSQTRQLQTAMHRAAASRNGAKNASLLIAAQGYESVVDCAGHSPLASAVHLGNVDMVRLLLLGEFQQHVNKTDMNGWKLLHHAITSKRDNVAEFLLDTFATTVDLHARHESGISVAEMAAQVDSRILARLLDAGVSFHEENSAGRQLMHVAAEAGNVDSLRLLIRCGANLECTDTEKRTPLFFAKDGKTVAFLLRAGCNPNAVDRAGRSVWHTASSDNVLATMFAHGAIAMLSHRDNNGMYRGSC